MHDLAWSFPPLKLSLRNENYAYGNMHHKMVSEQDVCESPAYEGEGGTLAYDHKMILLMIP